MAFKYFAVSSACNTFQISGGKYCMLFDGEKASVVINRWLCKIRDAIPIKEGIKALSVRGHQ